MLIGVPSEVGKDEIKLVLREADGAAFGPEALLTWCDTRLPRFIEFVRTPTQRIRKIELSCDTDQCWDAEAAACL